MKFARVVDVDGEQQICTRDKVSEFVLDVCSSVILSTMQG